MKRPHQVRKRRAVFVEIFKQKYPILVERLAFEHPAEGHRKHQVIVIPTKQVFLEAHPHVHEQVQHAQIANAKVFL
jgi:hypothetical protein